MPHITVQTDDAAVASFLRQGIRHHQRGELKAADTCYSKVLDRAPDHPDALHLSGVVAYQSGDPHRAVTLIRKAIAGDTAHPLFHHNLGNAFREMGALEAARAAYSTALRLKPDYAEALYGMGNILTAMGKFTAALSAYEKAAMVAPEMAEAHLGMGNLHREIGDFIKAVACYEKAVEINPHFMDAKLELGNTLLEMEKWDAAIRQYRSVLEQAESPAEIHFRIGNAWMGKHCPEAAVQSYQKALAADAGHAKAHLHLGLAHLRRGRSEAAASCFKKAMALDPDDAEADYHMGNFFYETGGFDEAITAYDAALKKRPDHAKALCKKGNALAALNQWDAAVAAYKKALTIRPEYLECLHRLGIALSYCGDPEAAVSHFKRVLEIRPGLPQVYNSLGNALKETAGKAEAESCYLKAIDLDPDFYEAWNNLGLIYTEQGRIRKAIDCFERMLAIKPDFGVEVKAAMMLPLFYEDTAEMNTERVRFVDRLDRLNQRSEILADPCRQVGMTNHNLALHGRNDREIREKIAAFYIRHCPDLAWCAPDLARPPLEGRTIRIGMLSRYLYNHTIGNLHAGAIKQLSREKFHVTVFRLPGKKDHLSEQIDKDADEVVMLPGDLQLARKKVAAYSLDILFFLEIGMDAWTYFLAFSRMAPVQIKRGFPVTSGIPAVDYFLSSEHFEPPDADDHYSEKLIRLKRSGYWYPRPKANAAALDRKQYGIPDEGKLYACLQSLFKFHPDFDAVLADILRKDPHGRLLLLGGLYDDWKNRWLRRFNKHHSDVSDRLIFLPQLGREAFISMFTIADAVLDTIHFGGGNTTLECFANEVPVVTWPSPYMRGRLTYGYYRMMGIMECVAPDLETYADIAVRLANDRTWHQQLKKKIGERSHNLFEDAAAIQELETVFDALARSPAGAGGQRPYSPQNPSRASTDAESSEK